MGLVPHVPAVRPGATPDTEIGGGADGGILNHVLYYLGGIQNFSSANSFAPANSSASTNSFVPVNSFALAINLASAYNLAPASNFVSAPNLASTSNLASAYIFASAGLTSQHSFSSKQLHADKKSHHRLLHVDLYRYNQRCCYFRPVPDNRCSQRLLLLVLRYLIRRSPP